MSDGVRWWSGGFAFAAVAFAALAIGKWCVGMGDQTSPEAFMLVGCFFMLTSIRLRTASQGDAKR